MDAASPGGAVSGVVLGEVVPFQLVVLPGSPALLPALRSSACPHCSAVGCPKGNQRPLELWWTHTEGLQGTESLPRSSVELGNAPTVLLEQTRLAPPAKGTPIGSGERTCKASPTI